MEKKTSVKKVEPDCDFFRFANVSGYIMADPDSNVVIKHDKENNESLHRFFWRAFRYAAEHDDYGLSHASTKVFPQEIEGWEKFSYRATPSLRSSEINVNVIYIDPMTDAWVEVCRDPKQKEDVWGFQSLLGDSEKGLSHADAISRVRLVISESRIRRYLTQVSTN